MSAPVDVLAVLDAVLAFAARGVESDDPAREMIESGYEARAAVAELIEAADYVARYVASFSAMTYSPEACKEANDRLTDALARVAGAA